ncbi:hypothetical protein BCR33DRAFT_719984 [Rhizoclosmatium globosum]|uniref:RRM domain-containing protein n=1 Tax=Rhizoclosmatium globosum TaxID=329046 RepID=A0A1Y2BXL0_9FUNG|nr:hypothetical protein BCR33DRAFT_719984 [Rhizoclosmatium globosum]|eukprot:ORY39509.1 hypothetical protein BCR33DRAFT_719984 [Rhizoclosmatium globosum]
MTDKMDMSLDDIVSGERAARGRGGGHSRSSHFDSAKGSRGRSNFDGRNPGRRGDRDRRSGPYSVSHRRLDPNEQWRHDKYEGADADLRERIGRSNNNSTASSSSSSFNNGNAGNRLAAATPQIAATGTIPAVLQSNGFTVRVLNLDPKASAADVQATFAEFGAILKCSVSYDSTSATGTAEITFKDRASIKGAIDTYNGVIADGRTLKVEELSPPAAKGLSITGRSSAGGLTSAMSTPPATVPVLKTSVGSVVVGGMYSDRVAGGQSEAQEERRIPITERLGRR